MICTIKNTFKSYITYFDSLYPMHYIGIKMNGFYYAMY